MFRILVVEDDRDLNRSVCLYLQENGYTTEGCLDAYAAYEAMHHQTFDLIISDVMMPKIDGFEFVESVRRNDENIPILLMSARDDMTAKRKGFRIGIDDYIVKPVNLDELLLRIEALLRRAKMLAKKKVEVGDLVLDIDGYTAYIQGEELNLTVREFNILYKLVSYPKKTFTRSQLMDEFWDTDSSSGPRVVDVYITKLRDKIAASQSVEIVTVHGMGYKAVIR